MSLLRVKGLSRHYGALKAVDDISFALEEGQILGFIGPNGAGTFASSFSTSSSSGGGSAAKS